MNAAPTQYCPPVYGVIHTVTDANNTVVVRYTRQMIRMWLDSCRDVTVSIISERTNWPTVFRPGDIFFKTISALTSIQKRCYERFVRIPWFIWYMEKNWTPSFVNQCIIMVVRPKDKGGGQVWGVLTITSTPSLILFSPWRLFHVNGSPLKLPISSSCDRQPTLFYVSPDGVHVS